MLGGSLRLLFVCTANVCRSPLAAGLMAFHARQVGASVEVASASVDAEIRDIHPSTVRALAERGARLSRTRSQPLDAQLTGGAHLILTMTAEHARAVVGRFPTERRKVFVLKHFATKVPMPAPDETAEAWLADVWDTRRNYVADTSWDVQDPIGLGDDVFRAVEQELDGALSWMAGGLVGGPDPNVS